MTEFFGEEAAAWGEGESMAGEELSVDYAAEDTSGSIDIGFGMRLVITPDAFKMIMHMPEITAKVTERCEELTAAANSLAVTEDAEYAFVVSNNPDNIRARGRVFPDNFKAVVDDEHHSTLLKALEQVGSDPYPTFASEGEVPEEGEPDVYSAPPGEAAAEEAHGAGGAMTGEEE